MADIKLLPYDEGMHDGMVRLVEQDNIFIAPWKGTEFYGKAIEDSIHRDGMLYRVVVDSESGEWNSVLAPVSLMEAFPGLRADEARAVCNDWRATYHERRTRPAARPV